MVITTSSLSRPFVTHLSPIYFAEEHGSYAENTANDNGNWTALHANGAFLSRKTLRLGCVRATNGLNYRLPNPYNAL